MQLPESWLAYAQEKRRWDKATTEDVLADFIEHWTNRTDALAAKVDWEKTWQTWVRRDRRPDGNWAPPGGGLSSDEFAQRCEEIAVGWEKMHRPDEAAKWRAKIHAR